MSTKAREHYPSNLTDGQWELLRGLLPQAKSGPGHRGRPPSDRRKIVEGILYVIKSGCQWRMLPKDYGCWETVYGYFRRWRKEKVWEPVLEVLNHHERVRQGRRPEPSAGCIDSQSVKAATQPIDQVGFDSNKKVKGRKRHILTDTLGLMLCVVVTAANVGDREGLKQLLNRWFIKGVRRIRKLWVDGGYFGEPLRQWVAALKKTHKIDLEVTDHQGKGFQVVAKRWVVERTFSWFGHFRRHSKDYERLPENSQALLQIAMIALLLRRLA
jgi:putative transposase